MVFVTLAFKDHVTGKNTNKQKNLSSKIFSYSVLPSKSTFSLNVFKFAFG